MASTKTPDAIIEEMEPGDGAAHPIPQLPQEGASPGIPAAPAADKQAELRRRATVRERKAVR